MALAFLALMKSNTFIPALVGGGDHRPLGVSLTDLALLGGAEARSISLDDERLQDGLHAGEAKAVSLGGGPRAK